eukprot:5458300-Pleurochrysis_carterae.AAC.2
MPDELEAAFKVVDPRAQGEKREEAAAVFVTPRVGRAVGKHSIAHSRALLCVHVRGARGCVTSPFLIHVQKVFETGGDAGQQPIEASSFVPQDEIEGISARADARIVALTGMQTRSPTFKCTFPHILTVTPFNTLICCITS